MMRLNTNKIPKQLEAAVFDPSEMGQRAPNFRFFKMFYKSLLLLLLTFGTPCFCLDHFYDTTGILSTVNEEIASIRQGDLHHAYTTLTTEKFKDSTCFDDFLLFISNIPTLYNNSSINLGLAKIEEKTGIYEGEIRTKEGERMAIRFDLKKGGKRWLIESIIVYPLNTKEMPSKTVASGRTIKDRFLKFIGFN